MKKNHKIFFLMLITGFLNGIVLAQNNTIHFDLSKIVHKNGWKIYNRKVDLLKENKGIYIHFNAHPGAGLAWHDDCNFNNGIIEVYVRGKEIQNGGSVGVAFNGVDEKTYDAVYFSLSNFVSKDSVRKKYSIQYISLPTHTSKKLNKDTPGKYKNEVDPVLDSNSFFLVKIVINNPGVSVFVNDNPNPCLVLNELSNRKGGWVGLWVGDNSQGTFTNLKIINTFKVAK